MSSSDEYVYSSGSESDNGSDDNGSDNADKPGDDYVDPDGKAAENAEYGFVP